MLTFVSADWVQERVGSTELHLLDPRSAVRYMAGHPMNAVNLPVTKVRDAEGNLFSPEGLAHLFGSAGLDDSRIPVLYDGADGRNAAMLAWILLYLGRTDVHLMDIFWERWVGEGRAAFYRPVQPPARHFTASVRPELRATLDQVRTHLRAGGGRANGARLIDFRSREEFTGKLDTDGRPGHIPGAVNIVWGELIGADGNFLAPREKLETLLAAHAIRPRDHAVAYCRTGIRAALGFLALTHLGRSASLYDGSFAEWARTSLPVEKCESGE